MSDQSSNNSLSTNQLSLKAKLLLGFFGLCLSALAVEVAVRVLVGGGKKQRPWTDRPYAYFLPDGAQTLQDAPPHPKPPGVFRIIVVGDSFTFGPHMQFSDTFPKKLEQMLNLNPKARRVEVLNRGVNGSSTANEVEWIKQALRESPDLLVLEITLNDAEPHILTDDERRKLFGATWLQWRIFQAWKSLGLLAGRIHNSLTVNRYIDYHSKFFKDPATRAIFSLSIERIANQAKTANVPLVAVVFPLFDFPIDRRYPFTEVHQIVQETLQSRGVRAIDLRDAYRGIPPDRLQVIPGEDNHPNEIAHRIAAERLLSVLATRQLVPEEVIPTRVFGDRQGLKTHSRSPNKTFRKAAKSVDYGLPPAAKTAAHENSAQESHAVNE